MFGILFGPGNLETSAITLGILFALCIPLVIVFIIQEKRNRNRMIVVQMNTPRGQVKGAVKIGFSWTIFFFWKWALLFRSQWTEFFIWLFVGLGFMILLLISLQPVIDLANAAALKGQLEYAQTFNPEIMSTADFPSMLSVEEAVKVNNEYYEIFNNELMNNMTWFSWTAYALKIASTIVLVYIYTLFGNKMRLKKLYARGAKFDLPENEDVADIYAYIGLDGEKASRGGFKVNPPGTVQGETHQYVVPDEKVTEPEETYDYSTLTPQDLKLLLKSEGIPFDSNSTKEELLELVEENIAKAQRAEAEKVKKQYSDSKYFTMTVQELVEELDKKNIKYTSTMKKADLVKLLVEDENKK